MYIWVNETGQFLEIGECQTHGGLMAFGSFVNDINEAYVADALPANVYRNNANRDRIDTDALIPLKAEELRSVRLVTGNTFEETMAVETDIDGHPA